MVVPIKIVIKYMEARKPFVDEMLKQLPNAILIKGGELKDTAKDTILTFQKGLMAAGNDATLQLQDDAELCDNFLTKFYAEVEKRPYDVIQLFSMRKADLTEGSRYDDGGKFLANVAVYFPPGMAKAILEYSYTWRRIKQYPSADDFIVRDFLKDNGINYWIVVPNLVNHRETRSLINPKRSSKRRSLTFVK